MGCSNVSLLRTWRTTNEKFIMVSHTVLTSLLATEYHTMQCQVCRSLNLCVGQQQANSLVTESRSKHASSVTGHSKKTLGSWKLFNSRFLARYQDICCIVKINVSHSYVIGAVDRAWRAQWREILMFDIWELIKKLKMSNDFETLLCVLLLALTKNLMMPLIC